MTDLEYLREQYRRQVEQHEAKAAEWAARAAREDDVRLRGDYQASAWQQRRAAEVVRRRLADLERRTRQTWRVKPT